MPKPETVSKALEQIGKSAANYQYFFDKLSSPEWLAPLAEKGRFKQPPEKQPVEGGVRFPGWPESQYLVRMVKIPSGATAGAADPPCHGRHGQHSRARRSHGDSALAARERCGKTREASTNMGADPLRWCRQLQGR